jgi:hypothetical protein
MNSSIVNVKSSLHKRPARDGFGKVLAVVLGPYCAVVMALAIVATVADDASLD